MKYAEKSSVEAGLAFKTPSGIPVKTTGRTVKIESHNLYVHEVVITEGTGQGKTFLHNLDAATPL